jgi:protein-disulfide isomerase
MNKRLVCLLLGTFRPVCLAECLPLDDIARERLLNYVRAKYRLSAAVRLKVGEVSTISGTCYTRLKFTAQGAKPRFDMNLVASPDFRFLSRELLDTQTDPLEEERRKQKTLDAALTSGVFPEMGPRDSAVTLVIFSDFQCPYCATLAKGLMKDIMPSEAGKLRIVFRNFPLSTHGWARSAAEAAACAKEQGDKYFWHFHDYLFEHQREITTKNLKQKLIELETSESDFDPQEFAGCLDEKRTSATVDGDIESGQEIGVEATPTVFVNGQKLIGVRLEQLRTVIRELGGVGAPK